MIYNSNKKKVELCTKCMELRLPEYNMGFNKPGWESYAKQKPITDIGAEGWENFSTHKPITVAEE